MTNVYQHGLADPPRNPEAVEAEALRNIIDCAIRERDADQIMLWYRAWLQQQQKG
jgi:hypothetical protein